eukprot:766629-Hanusia_phi.AAC.3
MMASNLRKRSDGDTEHLMLESMITRNTHTHTHTHTQDRRRESLDLNAAHTEQPSRRVPHPLNTELHSPSLHRIQVLLQDQTHRISQPSDAPSSNDHLQGHAHSRVNGSWP